MIYQEISLAGTREFGLIEEYEKLEQEKCRPFNRITIQGDTLIKEAIDEQGKKLAIRECAWYEKAKREEITERSFFGMSALIASKRIIICLCHLLSFACAEGIILFAFQIRWEIFLLHIMIGEAVRIAVPAKQRAL